MNTPAQLIFGRCRRHFLCRRQCHFTVTFLNGFDLSRLHNSAPAPGADHTNYATPTDRADAFTIGALVIIPCNAVPITDSATFRQTPPVLTPLLCRRLSERDRYASNHGRAPDRFSYAAQEWQVLSRATTNRLRSLRPTAPVLRPTRQVTGPVARRQSAPPSSDHTLATPLTSSRCVGGRSFATAPAEASFRRVGKDGGLPLGHFIFVFTSVAYHAGTYSWR